MTPNEQDYVYVVIQMGAIRESKELKTVPEAIAFIEGYKKATENYP